MNNATQSFFNPVWCTQAKFQNNLILYTQIYHSDCISQQYGNEIHHFGKIIPVGFLPQVSWRIRQRKDVTRQTNSSQRICVNVSP